MSAFMSHNSQVYLCLQQRYISSARRQKGLTGYCFKYIDRSFYLQTDDLRHVEHTDFDVA